MNFQVGRLLLPPLLFLRFVLLVPFLALPCQQLLFTSQHLHLLSLLSLHFLFTLCPLLLPSLPFVSSLLLLLTLPPADSEGDIDMELCIE